MKNHIIGKKGLLKKLSPSGKLPAMAIFSCDDNCFYVKPKNRDLAYLRDYYSDDVENSYTEIEIKYGEASKKIIDCCREGKIPTYDNLEIIVEYFSHLKVRCLEAYGDINISNYNQNDLILLQSLLEDVDDETYNHIYDEYGLNKKQTIELFFYNKENILKDFQFRDKILKKLIPIIVSKDKKLFLDKRTFVLVKNTSEIPFISSSKPIIFGENIFVVMSYDTAIGFVIEGRNKNLYEFEEMDDKKVKNYNNIHLMEVIKTSKKNNIDGFIFGGDSQEKLLNGSYFNVECEVISDLQLFKYSEDKYKRFKSNK